MILIAGVRARDRRALAVGVTSLGVLLTASKGLPAIRTWEAERVTAVSVAKHRHSALTRAVAQRAALETNLNDSRRRWFADSSFFAADDAGSLAARIVGLVRDVAAIDGVVLRMVQPRIDSTRNHLTLLASARVSMTADVEGLLTFVKDLETSKPLMRVSELSIVQSDPAAGDNRPDVLKVELTVQGVAELRATIANARKN